MKVHRLSELLKGLLGQVLIDLRHAARKEVARAIVDVSHALRDGLLRERVDKLVTLWNDHEIRNIGKTVFYCTNNLFALFRRQELKVQKLLKIPFIL